MSFDAFQARLDFLQLLRKLNASAQSIQKVVGYAIKYGSRCGEDLWECVITECEKANLNTRINILYFLDSLLDQTLSIGSSDMPYVTYITRDLSLVVGKVVPDTREGVLNLKAARQILDSWRTRRLLDTEAIDQALDLLSNRTFAAEESPKKRAHEQAFSRNEILRRMEEDRERHKRLRERIWILPIPNLTAAQPSQSRHPHSSSSHSLNPSPSSPFTPASPSTRGTNPKEAKMMPPPPLPGPDKDKAKATTAATALDVEFEQLWETTSDLGDDDYERMKIDLALMKQSTTELESATG